MTYGILIAVLAVTALEVAVDITTLSRSHTAFALTTSGGMRDLIGAASRGSIFLLVLGVLVFAGEYRHGTMSQTYLLEPRRSRVLIAKLITMGVIGFIFSLCTSALTLAMAIPWLNSYHIAIAPQENRIATVLIGSIAAMTLYSLLGVGVGALIRNQVAAIVAALAWLAVIENLVAILLPSVAKWLPGMSSTALVDASIPNSHLLSMWSGGVVFAGYCLAFAIAGGIAASRRDIS
jgi:ABC-type transport system involved in multi-copper enzyme maturation permease subunit